MLIYRERIPFFCKYYKELLEETYNAWGTAVHRNFIRRFELMAKSNDNDFDKAKEFAILNSKENEDNEIKIIGSDIASYLSLIYKNLGYYDRSLPYLMESLKINEELKDKVRISADYANFGEVYYYKGQLDDALGYYKKALELHEELKDIVSLVKDYCSIANVYLYKNDKEKSNRAADNAQKIVMEFEQSAKYRHPFADNLETLLNRLK